jgi:ABC-type sugar transport system ATPase subunit
LREGILEFKNIRKHFGGIQALKGINLSVYEGEVHALVGENGAGKSTLIKILTGVIPMDEGEIYLNGKKVIIEDPVSSRFKGIAAIYQELSLIEHLNVAQNIFLGHEPSKGTLGWLDKKLLLEKTQSYLETFGIQINPETKVHKLGLGEKKIIEILKALSVNAKILLLDEPTTGMSKVEIDTLFKIMDGLKKQRVTMIYISHHLEEIFRICNRVSVLRDGEYSGTFEIDKVDTSTLIRTMIGRDIKEEFPERDLRPGADVLLKTENFFAEDMLKPVSLKLHSGEILGITGIIGAGKSELGMALFGASKTISGKFWVKGDEVVINNPEDARRNGIAFIPEDRKEQGLFLNQSVEDNLTVANIDQLLRGLLISMGKRRQVALDAAKKLKVIPLNMLNKVKNLSGGNQQKVVIGKWLISNPPIIIMDDPTRGIDVGAKVEIYNLIKELADNGAGIILLSSEFKEVSGLCDRILVLRKGEIIREIKSKGVSSRELLEIALGGIN